MGVPDTVTLFLAGDVMTGRGVDQILPHPGDPEIRENWIRDARRYVSLAEGAHGPIPRPAGFEWPWGEALTTLAQVAPAVSVVDLETAVTAGGGFVQGKAIHYRMNPPNLATLRAAGTDVCVLANNHVLDFDRAGLTDTLAALAEAGLAAVGAGEDLDRALSPAVVPIPDGGRVVVLAGARGAPRGLLRPRPVRGHGGPHRRPPAGRPPPRRRRRRLAALGVELGLRRLQGADPLRAPPGGRRRGRRPRPLLAPRASDRGLPPAADPLRLRGPDQR